MYLRTVVLVSLLVVDIAAAKLCGDNIDGEDVPCACGDIVASSVVLDDDPVTTDVCAGDGLLVRASGNQPLEIDLAGKTLRGRGRGHGLLLIYGGEGGAGITSSAGRALLSGFDHGVVASASDGLRLVEKVTVEDSVHDGIRVRGAALVRHCEVVRAGRDGFALSGRGYRAEGNRSISNGRHGFFLMGSGGNLTDDNKAQQNGGSGFLVSGASHVIADCVASDNGKNGFDVTAERVSIAGCTVDRNFGSGIDGHGAGWQLSANSASYNREHGIHVRGGKMQDLGGNVGEKNGRENNGDGTVQCSIGGVDCRTEAAQ